MVKSKLILVPFLLHLLSHHGSAKNSTNETNLIDADNNSLIVEAVIDRHYDCNETILNNEIRFLDSSKICHLKPLNDTFIGYFFIESNDGDYLKSNIDFWANSNDYKLLIIDDNSDRILSSFYGNNNNDNNCETLNESQTFISDSNKIRIEFMIHHDDKGFYANENGEEKIRFQNDDVKSIMEFKISYEKINFESIPIKEKYDDENGFQIKIDSYRPNSVWTYVMPKTEENEFEYKIGVHFTIKHLDLDFMKNDYLIICPGMESQFWFHSKCQIVTQRISNEKNENGDIMRFWVNADSAFLKVVTHNSFISSNKILEAYGFQANKTVKKLKNNEIPNRIKMASTQLCFEQFCINWHSNYKDKFRQDYALKLNNYLIEHESNISMLVEADDVLIIEYRNESISTSRYNVVCRVSVAVTSAFDPEYPLVDGDTLHHMYFGSSKSIIFNGIRVTDCSYLSITIKEIIIPIILIIFIFSFITILFWHLQTKLIKNNYKKLKNTSNLK